MLHRPAMDSSSGRGIGAAVCAAVLALGGCTGSATTGGDAGHAGVSNAEAGAGTTATGGGGSVVVTRAAARQAAALVGANDCGAIYELKNADVNASLPPENWQTYEITFRAPRWSGQTKTENAKISVIWNG